MKFNLTTALRLIAAAPAVIAAGKAAVSAARTALAAVKPAPKTVDRRAPPPSSDD